MYIIGIQSPPPKPEPIVPVVLPGSNIPLASNWAMSHLSGQ